MLKWITAICPICYEKYQYIEGHEAPKTCSKFECLQKYFLKGIRYDNAKPTTKTDAKTNL